MARTKLIAKYAALDTPDLPQRIFDTIALHISQNGIEELPYMEINGRWTGKLHISDGGWRGDFDLLIPVLALCRVDRNATVSPDLAKIERHVADWRERLHTPDENDIYLGVDDEHFSDKDYLTDDEESFMTAAYNAEFDSFMKSDNPDMLAYDNALTEIDNIVYDSSMPISPDSDSDKIFQEGFSMRRIDNADDFKRLIEAMNKEAEEGGGIAWVNPDLDLDNLDDMFASTPNPGSEWMTFIDDLRNGRFGELPEDYDGLAEDPEETQS